MLSICADISLLKHSNFTITDIEVTGLEKTDRIIEIGAIKILGGKRTECFHSFIRPDFDYDKSILCFLGIADDDLQNATSVSCVLGSFKAFVGSDTLLIHNAPFDVHYLNAELAASNIELDNQVIDLCTVVNSPRPRALKKYASEMGIPAPDHYSVCNSLILIEEILKKSGIISKQLNMNSKNGGEGLQ